VVETRKIVTIVFSDVSGSTPLGERLDAEVLRRVMERYFEEMRTILERHSTVEKFIGDAVMGRQVTSSTAGRVSRRLLHASVAAERAICSRFHRRHARGNCLQLAATCDLSRVSSFEQPDCSKSRCKDHLIVPSSP
jgi:class 3 adenylate cyclase